MGYQGAAALRRDGGAEGEVHLGGEEFREPGHQRLRVGAFKMGIEVGACAPGLVEQPDVRVVVGAVEAVLDGTFLGQGRLDEQPQRIAQSLGMFRPCLEAGQ